jgi:hypothetical protein
MLTMPKAEQSGFFSATIADGDPEVADAIGKELGRQQHEIELIASENIVSKAVLEAAGTVLTNKYAEGYPGGAAGRHDPRLEPRGRRSPHARLARQPVG